MKKDNKFNLEWFENTIKEIQQENEQPVNSEAMISVRNDA